MANVNVQYCCIVIYCLTGTRCTVFAIISAPGAYKISHTDKIQIPHNQLSLSVFKSSFYHVWLLRYCHFTFCKCENLFKTYTKNISATKNDRNWYVQLIMRNLNFISLNNFLSARGAYYGEYGIYFHIIKGTIITKVNLFF